MPDDGSLFLLGKSLPERLPAMYEPWERVADRLPELNRSGKLAAAVQSLPVIDAGGLQGTDLNRAAVLLSLILHSFVNGPTAEWSLIGGTGDGTGNPRTRVPQAIARPYLNVSRRLGVPPVLIATLADVWNTDAGAALAALPPMYRQFVTMTGTESELGFHQVPAAIQRAANPVAHTVAQRLPEIAATCDDEGARKVLLELTAMWRKITEYLEYVWRSVDPDVFYRVYRPLLGGFHPDGVTFCGAASDGGDVKVDLKGPSAGQSSVFILIDMMMGVKHFGSAREFQSEMHEYVPETQAQYLRDFRRQMRASMNTRYAESGLRGMATRPDAPAALKDAYIECAAAHKEFRLSHLAIAVRYLRATQQGTGSSTFREMLREGVDATGPNPRL